MFVVLFEPDAFDTLSPSPAAAVMITYWMAFAGFFFGLTYGLLQVCTERPIFERERFVNLGIWPYLLAKLTVLVPVLAAVGGVMVVVLRATDRLPHAGTDTTTMLVLILLIDAVAGLALGLLASAAVADAAEATIALPMLCFPAVLFSGAILPVHEMAMAGRVISYGVSDRWAYEAAGRSLHLDRLAPELIAQHGSAFTGSTAPAWAALTVMTFVFMAAAPPCFGGAAQPGVCLTTSSPVHGAGRHVSARPPPMYCSPMGGRESTAATLARVIAPAHTAVLLQELQRGVAGDESSLPALAAVVAELGVLDRAKLLTDAAREVGVPVVHCTAENLTNGFGVNRNARLFAGARKAGAENAPGTTSVAPVPEVGPVAGDIVLPRYHGLSPMTGSALDSLLRNQGITTVIVAGVSTNIAIPNLVFDAVNRSYQVVLVRDAVAGVPAEFTDQLIANSLALVATLASAQDIAEAWADSPHETPADP